MGGARRAAGQRDDHAGGGRGQAPASRDEAGRELDSVARPDAPPGVGFNAIWADVYWIRAVQYYGTPSSRRTRRRITTSCIRCSTSPTSLDPHFNIAYRFGSILLSEGYPNGPGQPDQAIVLLQKGIREMPDKWQYFHDAGFVEYRWRRDAQAAADWFIKGSKMPGAPNWLELLAASVLAEGGEREASRQVWIQLNQTADHEWIRQAARRGLMQLDAEAHIEILEGAGAEVLDMNGRFPARWED